MDDYDDTNGDDDSCYEIEDGNGNTEDDGNDDNDGSVNTGGEEEDENYDNAQDRESVSNDMLGEYDWKSISDIDNESVASLPHHRWKSYEKRTTSKIIKNELIFKHICIP